MILTTKLHLFFVHSSAKFVLVSNIMKKSNNEQHVVLLSGFNRVDGRYSATLTACLKINQLNSKSFFFKKVDSI